MPANPGAARPSATAPSRAPPAGPAPATAARLLAWGDYAPYFRAAALSGSPSYAFDTAAGRHILMLFYGTLAHPPAVAALAAVARERALFDDEHAAFFGITVEPRDARSGGIAQSLPGIRFFLDYDRRISALYGASPSTAEYLPHWLLLDPGLRVIGRWRLGDADQVFAAMRDAIAAWGAETWAPVVQVPRILEPELCRELIARYESAGGEDSGFMREVDGKTVLVTDPVHKQRRDHVIQDGSLQQALVARLNRRLSPALRRAFQFEPTRIERYLVACYEPGHGHFRPHRDNTTKGTAHRKFAVTINLNADDYEGGDLRFPEYGTRTYRAPTGGAVVFSCSLLHEATPVTKGRRFAFLPFLYDEEGARIREENNPYLGDGLGEYRKEG